MIELRIHLRSVWAGFWRSLLVGAILAAFSWLLNRMVP